MLSVSNVQGLSKTLFNLKVKVRVFFHYAAEWLTGKLTFGQLVMFLRRLLYFFSKLQHNKFCKIGKKVKIDMYIPAFPSKAFFTACDKFKTFGEKLPCTTVLLSVTKACQFQCVHCYQRLDMGHDIDINLLVRVTKRLQELGIAFYNIEGGDPFLVYPRLKAVCEAIDERSEIWVNSTGNGITEDALKSLKEHQVSVIMFSLHSPEKDKLNHFMGSPKAWDTLVEGVELCHRADIGVAFNVCLLKEDFYNGTFSHVMEKAKEFGASLVQLIHPKSAGAWLSSQNESFSPADLETVKQLVHQYNHHPDYRDYPTISAQILEEDPSMFGCTAGGTDRFYINAKGDVQPCEFLNMSFGNIQEEDFDKIYRRMRQVFETPGECWLCQRYSPDIDTIRQTENLKTMPLDNTKSSSIYERWERGKYTELYEVLEKRLTPKKKVP